MDITVTIKCPDLVVAARTLASAFGEKHYIGGPEGEPGVPAEVAPPMPQPPVIAPAVMITKNPTPVPAPTAVPTSPAPQITGDMVAKAGADLLAQNPAAMPQLMGLLQKYGVGCAQELKPDQIGPFATEMRALGAKI